jgi:hypothetical protein
MRIVLEVAELLFDIRNKSHEECASITDVEARYRAEAGHHKDEEIFRSLVGVNSSLTRLVRRYLVDSIALEADDNASIPDSFVYEFEISQRRADNLTQPMADAMHDYLVHYTLAKFYATVSQGDLSNKHSALTQAAATEIEELLYTKKPPMIS